MAEDTNRDRVTSRRLLRGNMGRPRFDIEQDQLEYLLDLCFTCPDIARLLGVSLRTVRRRMEEFGICVRDRYSSISDAELDEELVSIKYIPMRASRPYQVTKFVVIVLINNSLKQHDL